MDTLPLHGLAATRLSMSFLPIGDGMNPAKLTSWNAMELEKLELQGFSRVDSGFFRLARVVQFFVSPR
jgi:hypothetical protein